MIARFFRLFFIIAIIHFMANIPAFGQLDLYVESSSATAGRPHDMVVSGDYIFLGDWNGGFTVINKTNPWLPEQVFNYNTPGLVNSVFLHDSLALVTDWSYGIEIFNISDPTSPEMLSSWNTPGAAYYSYAQGNFAYIAEIPLSV